MAMFNLYAGLILMESPHTLYITPRDGTQETLVINRGDQRGWSRNRLGLRTHVDGWLESITYDARYPIYGLMGIKHFFMRSYLIVITHASPIGSICGQTIYRVDDTKIIQINQPIASPTPEIDRCLLDREDTYLKMLEDMLKVPNFYFSYSYDLTNSLQRNYALADLFKDESERDITSSICSYYDKRFLWNNHLMEDFIEIGFYATDRLQKYRLPVILGFVSINENALGHAISWSLISRRSVRRAGTRFLSRGIDREGNVSNFVETEQVIEQGSTRASHIQIRGSIPIFWTQEPGYKYKPTINILHEDHCLAMEKHIEELNKLYGDISIACLIDQRGHEGNLAREFAKNLGQLQKHHNVHYHYFDFHKECSGFRWHNLKRLLDQLEKEIDSHNHFLVVENRTIRRQSGVVRSNCIDSLDRTNVVQTMIAQYIMEAFLLKSFGTGFNAQTLSSIPHFMGLFKNVWADNADALSTQYAGTPALKTDLTRTGHRTISGLWNDGLNSLTRYVSNNFLDSYRQSAIDLFLSDSSPSIHRPLDLEPYKLPMIMFMLYLALYLYLYIDQ